MQCRVLKCLPSTRRNKQLGAAKIKMRRKKSGQSCQTKKVFSASERFFVFFFFCAVCLRAPRTARKKVGWPKKETRPTQRQRGRRRRRRSHSSKEQQEKERSTAKMSMFDDEMFSSDSNTRGLADAFRRADAMKASAHGSDSFSYKAPVQPKKQPPASPAAATTPAATPARPAVLTFCQVTAFKQFVAPTHTFSYLFFLAPTPRQ